MTFRIDVREALKLEEFLDDYSDNVNLAASYALNDVVSGNRGLGRYKKAIEREVNFPQGYVGGDNFYFAERATPTKLSAELYARQRPTSLARFAASGAVGQKGGVRVRVKKGGREALFKRGFLVRLRAGTALGGNVGLAVRLAPGQTLNKRDTSRMVHLEPNVVLLYGPSIDQILRNEAADTETPAVVDDIASEFFRQLARLSNG